MLLLNNDEVEQALTPQDAITSTETIYRELAEGKAQLINHATTGDLFRNPINYLQKKRRMKRVCDSDSRDNANGGLLLFH